ncbi:PilN domain-containing protein [Kiloniella litopenaei]|uniref:PilN domain-containing protein n=1 Tax=Kiloniella litopenaei TaxID=1549748 RepID=UPI003BACD9F1
MTKYFLFKQAIELIANAVKWWCAELSSLFACPFKIIKRFVFKEYELKPNDIGGFDIYKREGVGVQHLGVISTSSQLEINTVFNLSWLRTAFISVWPLDVSLVIEEKNSLTKVIKLPLLSGTDLESAISYDLIRHIPFTRDEVYLGWRVLDVDKQNKSTSVKIFAVPKMVIVPSLEKLSDFKIPIKDLILDRMDQASEMRVSLLDDYSNRASRDKTLWMFNGIAVTALLIALVYLPFYKLTNQLVYLEEQISSLQKPAKDAVTARENIKKKINTDAALSEWRGKQVSSLLLLEVLSKELNTDTWVYELSYTQSNLNLKGYALESSELIKILESFSFIDKAEFTSSVLREGKEHKEHFQLRANFRNSL